jgi:hypothetical protein
VGPIRGTDIRRWIILLALGLVPGCDVATAALIISSQQDSDDDGDPLPALPGFPTASFKAWVGSISDPLTERNLLFNNGGEPSSPTWTEVLPEVASGTPAPALATAIYNPTAPPASINAILVQVSSTENFHLDSVEIMDSLGKVLEHASGPPYFDLVTDPDRILGPPDGATAVTNAVDVPRAFIFTIYTGPIDRFRINARGVSKTAAPSDVVAVGAFQSFVNELPGGMAIRSDGRIHLTLSVADTGRLVRFGLDGLFVDDTEISADLATAGLHSVALNPTGVIFTACSTSTGVIQVKRLAETNLALEATATFSSGSGSDRVEANSIAVDGGGNVIVVGGMTQVPSGRNHWRVKLPATIIDPPLWQSSAPLDSSTSTYWHAVTTGPDDDVYTSGDNLSNLFGGTIQAYSGRFNSAGTATWDHSHPEGQTPADVGHSIALDLAGNYYVGGYVGKSVGGRNGLLIRYVAGGASYVSQEFPGVAGGDDEILDIAVDADGSIYAVGYENVAGQGENWWVRKLAFNPNLNQLVPVWARTHHGGFGSDRAVSVAIHQDRLVVAGYEANGSGQSKLVLRVYQK